MPQIQSRKYPENQQYVDPETWDLMQKKGLSRRFKIVDDHDLHATITRAPLDIVDFTKEEMSREEIKAKLDELEIEYNKYANTETLLILLNDNQ